MISTLMPWKILCQRSTQVQSKLNLLVAKISNQTCDKDVDIHINRIHDCVEAILATKGGHTRFQFMYIVYIVLNFGFYLMYIVQ